MPFSPHFLPLLSEISFVRTLAIWLGAPGLPLQALELSLHVQYIQCAPSLLEFIVLGPDPKSGPENLSQTALN